MNKMIVASMLTLILSGCDNQSATKLDQQQQATEQESAKFDCGKGKVSIECEVVSGDQLGSGKWRHARLDISGAESSLNMDGESFYQTDVQSSFINGKRHSTYKLKGMKGSTAEISLSVANSENSLSVEVYDSNGKLMLTSTR